MTMSVLYLDVILHYAIPEELNFYNTLEIQVGCLFIIWVSQYMMLLIIFELSNFFLITRSRFSNLTLLYESLLSITACTHYPSVSCSLNLSYLPHFPLESYVSNIFTYENDSSDPKSRKHEKIKKFWSWWIRCILLLPTLWWLSVWSLLGYEVLSALF